MAAFSAAVTSGCEASGITLFSQVFLIAVIIALAAALWLRLAVARGWIGAARRDGHLEVLERRAFGPRSELIAARVLDHVVVFASTPAGVTRLDRIPLARWRGRGFADLLASAAQQSPESVDLQTAARTAAKPGGTGEEDDLVC